VCVNSTSIICVCVCTIWFEPYNPPPPLFFIYQVV
jgi:hypothetical protein